MITKPAPNFFQRFLHRKIQFDITSIFIILLTTFSLTIMLYIYKKNSKNILDLSDLIVEQVSDKVIDNINDMFLQTRNLAEESNAIITDLKQISLSNRLLISYFINVLKVEQNLYSINIAGSNGNFLTVFNLTRTGLYYYYSEPKKPLPKGAKYAVRVIDNTAAKPIETWEYLDTENKVIGSENTEPTYDPRNDPWYTQMLTWPNVHWNTSYLPRGTSKFISEVDRKTGVTVSAPITDLNDQFIAVMGININLEELSNFISHQKIGIDGRAFVLDSQGNILMPSGELKGESQYPALINLVHKNFLQTSQQNFVLENQGIKYLTRISEFSLTDEELWYIALIVPFNDFFGTTIKAQHETLFISLCLLIIFSVLIYYSSKHISIPIMQLADEVNKLRHFNFDKGKKIRARIVEINILDAAIDAMRAALLTFGRYIPKDIVKGLIKQGQAVTIGGERHQITIMFSDISNFTTYSESLPVEKLTTFLTSYFDALSKIILAENGTIDKYIGDSIMVFWGAPQPVTNQETKACRTALRCLAACIQQQKEHPSENWISRFGIHSGEAYVGNIGTTERMNYTVIGDTVNTAARLQDLNKQYLTSIIITETVLKKIENEFVVRPLDFLAVKGKKIKIAIFELVGAVEGEFACTKEQVDFCREFSIAYGLFREGKLAEAKILFLALQNQHPSDQPTKIYLERIEKA